MWIPLLYGYKNTCYVYNYCAINWGEPERAPHDQFNGGSLCLSVCQRTFIYCIYVCPNWQLQNCQLFDRIYACSNLTPIHTPLRNSPHAGYRFWKQQNSYLCWKQGIEQIMSEISDLQKRERQRRAQDTIRLRIVDHIIDNRRVTELETPTGS